MSGGNLVIHLTTYSQLKSIQFLFCSKPDAREKICSNIFTFNIYPIEQYGILRIKKRIKKATIYTNLFQPFSEFAPFDLDKSNV